MYDELLTCRKGIVILKDGDGYVKLVLPLLQDPIIAARPYHYCKTLSLELQQVPSLWASFGHKGPHIA